MPGASGETGGMGGAGKPSASDGGCGCRLGQRPDSRPLSSIFAIAFGLAALRFVRRRRKDPIA
jgi:MYXO-CTERM domain-containing protein